MAWMLLISGLAVLTLGAHALVKGGSALALRFGLTPLVIGLTVMAYGTSSPEVVVSAQAAVRGNEAIAIGNAIGSNLCNLGLILGLCALVRPMTAAAAVIRREVPILIGITILASAALLDGGLQRWEGILLLVALVVYTALTVRAARRESGTAADQEFAREIGAKVPGLAIASVLTLVGLGLLILGSDFFVRGAVDLARAWGFSDVVIGLTVVAVGTSLPELATSFVAVLKREGDVAVGNIVGSNLFNLMGILGIVGVLGGGEAEGLALADLVALLIVTVLLLPLVRTGGRISRWEGVLLLAAYVGYTLWMIKRQS